jgi:hypothetical protein
MDARGLLPQQHEEVDQLIEALEKATGRNKQALFNELADKVAAHASIEEKRFYPAALTPETEIMLRESVEEHLAVRRVLVDMLALKVDGAEFDAKIQVVKEQQAARLT